MNSQRGKSTLFDISMTLGLAGSLLLFLWVYVQIVPDPFEPSALSTDHGTSLSINHDRFTPHEDNTWHLKGTLSNRTLQEYGRIIIRVDFLDEDGEIVVSDHAILNGNLQLRPGDDMNFKISKVVLQTKNLPSMDDLENDI